MTAPRARPGGIDPTSFAVPRPRPGILEITPYVGGKAGDGSRTFIKLSSNENALGPSPAAVAAYHDDAASLHRYPDGNATALRRAIGARFGLDPERIVCGAGSDELIALLVRAYAGPGDEVLHSAHGFLMYRLAALGAGAIPVAAPERDLTADVDGLLAAVTSRTRLVFLANPNNPTGSYLTTADLERLRAGLPEDVVLVLDAAYAEYVRRNDYADGTTLVDGAPNVVMTRTFSKIFALPALRLGWMYARPEIVDAVHRVRGPFNVTTTAQVCGIAALADEAHVARSVAHNDHGLARLADALRDIGLTVHPSVANFLLVEFPREAGADAASASAFLEHEGILARSMDAYGLGHCLRITIGLEDENRAVADALARFVGRA